MVIVPVNGEAGFSATDFTTELNKIYDQSVVNWNVTLADRYDIAESEWDKDDDHKLNDGESTLLSNYSDEQNKLKRKYKNSPGIDIDKHTYYVFLLNGISSETGLAGYMPLKEQFAFIYNNNTDARTIAHELGHGAFRLWHTFSAKSKYYMAEKSSDNLMDYNNGKHLHKYQWDFIHNPEGGLYMFQDEMEGAKFDYRFLPEVYRKWLIETINLTLGKSSLFATVFSQVKSSSQLFTFNIYTLNDIKYIDPSTNGFFRPATDRTEEITFVDAALNWFFSIPIIPEIVEAGDEINPHSIKFSLNINTYEEYNETTTKSPPTIFEEIFHGAQYLFYGKDNTKSALSIETEVKIARGFVLYMSGGLYDSNFKEWVKRDDWGKSIYNWDKEKEVFIYPGILAYFKAIKDKKEITTELELNYRSDIIKYAKELVFPTYAPIKKWSEEMKNSYDGTTDYLNSILK